MGQQSAVLPAGRRTMVQSVLWTVARQGFPHLVAHADDIVILHPDGAERGILECLGHHSERVERLFAEDDYRAHYRYHCSNHQLVPAAVYLKRVAVISE